MTTSQARRADNDTANSDSKNEKDSSFSLEERNSLELVIAFTGPVGSGVTTTRQVMTSILENDFGYTVHPIKISDLIKVHAGELDISLKEDLAGVERVKAYQSAGNKLRKKRSTYLADRVIEKINDERRKSDGVLEREDAPDIPIQKRTAYLVDSLKNPAEVMRFRQIYGDLFWMVTVFAPETIREKRLIADGHDSEIVKSIMKHDEAEGEKHGQQVSKTAHLADYFVRNNSDSKVPIDPSVRRFLETIFGTKLYTPKKDEAGMMKAASAAIKSACMSRQVGAAIYSENGELIGVGCNDVPKSGGGLYSSDLNDEDDKRCFRWRNKICHNDDRKKKLANGIAKKVVSSKENQLDNLRNIVDQVSGSDAKNLIEFSRSVHAEMEAIVSVARNGKGSTLNGVLYSTTFPCHNCARHIVAAGISKVVYIEPYSKSLALDLHDDSITVTDEKNKVHFVQYEGFAPRSSLRVFSSVGRERKDDDGKFIENKNADSIPLFPNPLDSYMNSEELIISELTSFVEGLKNGEKGTATTP